MLGKGYRYKKHIVGLAALFMLGILILVNFQWASAADGVVQADRIGRRPRSYKITYDLNRGSYNSERGSAAMKPSKKISGRVLVLTDAVPTRPGYTFLGWGTSISADSLEYPVGEPMLFSEEITKPKTLYAIWSKKQQSQ